MNQNVYVAPSAELADPDEINPAADTMFYVVSRKKFLVLYFMTAGIYILVWLFKHWKHYKNKTGESIKPALRTIFGIFFMHSLFSKINSKKTEMGDQTEWAHDLHATGLVTLMIISQIADRLGAKSEGSALDLLALVFLLPQAALLLRAQEYANIACADPEGESNSRFTGLNWFWIGLGALMWILIAVGTVAIILNL